MHDIYKADYDSSNPTYSHFTQMVWKGTTELGCAIALCDGIFDASFGKASYMVCEYNPPGNVIGQFAYVHDPLHAELYEVN